MTEGPQSERDSGGSTLGWKLAGEDRRVLLERFSPAYPEVVADHVTLEADVPKGAAPREVSAAIVGRANDGAGVEAMAVAIDGSTDRPDGSVFHITWSLSPGRRAMESNYVLKARGWVAFDAPIPIRLEPATWP